MVVDYQFKSQGLNAHNCDLSLVVMLNLIEKQLNELGMKRIAEFHEDEVRRSWGRMYHGTISRNCEVLWDYHGSKSSPSCANQILEQE
jgi:hypothetical protein